MHCSTTEVPQQLALLCLSHFEKEEAVLQTSLESLREIQAAIVSGRVDRLMPAVRRHEESTRLTDELSKTRRLLRERLAGFLQVPVQRITLRLVSDRAPQPLRQHLLASRQRLLQISDDIEHTNRANAALLQQSMNLLQRLMGCLFGNDDQNRRYTAEGLREPVDGSNFLNTNC